MDQIAVTKTRILLPADGTDLTRWACVACDQYTSQPEYWNQVDDIVGAAPSTLRLMLPECRLDQTDELVPVIDRAMEEYLQNGLLKTAVAEGMILTERTVAAGKRIGLVCAIDLEDYSFDAGSKSLIRPTEQTIRSRLPARQKIRRGAVIEMPHIMMLTDDPDRAVIEPLYQSRDELPLLYDFELMMNGGHLRGWAVEGVKADEVLSELTVLKASKGADPLLFAVGDGNHSLATAKVCWDELKASLPEAERENHPARYALVEIENIYDEALNFEPIHRIIRNADISVLMADMAAWCAANGMQLINSSEGQSFDILIGDSRVTWAFENPTGHLTVETLQAFLDLWLSEYPEASIDYIHGTEAMLELCSDQKTIGFMLPALDKSAFFDILEKVGVMPRKTFSLGEANEKRFYMECRSLKEER